VIISDQDLLSQQTLVHHPRLRLWSSRLPIAAKLCGRAHDDFLNIIALPG